MNANGCVCLHWHNAATRGQWATRRCLHLIEVLCHTTDKGMYQKGNGRPVGDRRTISEIALRIVLIA